MFRRCRPINPHDRAWVRRLALIRTAAADARGRSESFLRRRTADRRHAVPTRRHDRERFTAEAIGDVVEAVRRVDGKTLYDVQCIAGWVLAGGTIAQVNTGEGKTLITAIPAYLASLAGRGVHVATTNDYLSRRDYEALRPVFRMLGVTVGHIATDQSPPDKRSAYRRDVTYGPGYEFGFDYLRDQIERRRRSSRPPGERFAMRLSGRVDDGGILMQRHPFAAIVDEADGVMIDEAGTPLVLSGGDPGPQTDADAFAAADRLATEFTDEDVTVDGRRLRLTSAGERSIRERSRDVAACRLARPWRTLVLNALKARRTLRRDVDYVVTGDAVCLVDPHTGRIHDERKWQDGLHQAVEVAEGLRPGIETVNHVRIARQRLLGMYEHLAGLTGTAETCADELSEVYGLRTSVVPPNVPSRRVRHPTRYFADAAARDAHVVARVRSMVRDGRAVLVGTVSVAESRRVGERLASAGVDAVTLNGTQDADESRIVADAGRPGRVTVATNMAGRGTDIPLSPAVRAAGGLHVLATQFQPSRRVDRQLAGRAGRRGDPGSVEFLASADDDIIDGTPLSRRLRRITDPDGLVSGDYDATVRSIQERLESAAAASRRQLVRRNRWTEELQEMVA